MSRVLTEHGRTRRRVNEQEMVEHLQDLGIDLTGFDMDGIDPIPSRHGQPDRRQHQRLDLDPVLA